MLLRKSFNVWLFSNQNNGGSVFRWKTFKINKRFSVSNEMPNNFCFGGDTSFPTGRGFVFPSEETIRLYFLKTNQIALFKLLWKH